MTHLMTFSARCLALGVSVFCAAPAFAATSTSSTNNNWYAGLSGDATWPSHANTGGGGNIDVGYKFGSGTMGAARIEAEAGYHAAGGDSGFGDVRYFTYMGNAYYDFANLQHSISSGIHVTPYVGAGLGLATVHEGNGDFTTTFHHHSDAFAYQGMAGLSFVLGDNPNHEWNIGYRYLDSDRDEGVKLHANNAELGYKYHF